MHYVIIITINLLLLNVQLNPLYIPNHYPHETRKHSLMNTNKQFDLKNTSEGLRVSICIGTPLHRFDLAISLNHYFTWLVSVSNSQTITHKYSPSNSSTCKIFDNTKTKLTFPNNKEIEGIPFSDVVWFNTITPINIQLLSVPESMSIPNIEGMLSLGYYTSMENNNYTLIEQLYNSNAITHRLFSIYLNSNEGKLTIGSIYSKIDINSPIYKQCNTHHDKLQLKTNQSHWLCKLKLLTIDMKEKEKSLSFVINNVIGFDYNIQFVLVPIIVFFHIKTSIFQPFIKERRCSLEIKRGYHVFSCISLDVLNEMQLIRLRFEDKWSIVVSNEKLFLKDSFDQQYVFIIACEANASEENRYVIGYSVLQYFSLVFNQDDNYIGFDINNDNTGDIRIQIHNDTPDFPQSLPDNDDLSNSIPNKSLITYLKFVLVAYCIFVIFIIVIWFIFRSNKKQVIIK